MLRKIVTSLLLLTSVASADTPPPSSIFGMKAGTSTGLIQSVSGVISAFAPCPTVGHILKSNGSAWTCAADGGGNVSSVNGETGAVVLDTDDIDEGSTNKYYDAAQAKTDVVADSVTDGITDVAPSQNAVYDALAAKQASGSYITALTSDVSATGPGSAAATVNSVGGTSAASVASSVTTVAARTSANTPSTIVSRDASGNFSAGTITANVTGIASGNELPITATTSADYWRGDKSFQPLSPAVRALVSATSPLAYNSSTGDFSIQQANGSQAGYLSSADWTVFNAKAPPTRLISTTAPLTGGGDLSADRTLDISNFGGDTGSGGTKGAVLAPTINQGVTNKFLSANGTFAHPGTRYTPSEAATATTTWTGRTASGANQWFGMVWAPELQIFCGIASSGTNRVQWSRDGITWTAASAASTVVWTKLAWSPALRLFAAVAFDGTTSTNLMTSPDCRTWVNQTSTEANQWYDITWAPSLGKFLAVSINGTTSRCMQSTNGTSWTTCTMAAAIQWYAVTWSDDLQLFVAVSITASSGNYAATSPDGNTWTMQPLSTGNTWYSVTWGKEAGRFCTVGATGTSRAAYSANGSSWTLSSIASQAWRRVKWSPEQRLFVAVSSGGAIATSPDCQTWTSRTAAESIQFYDLAWSPELGIWALSGITGTSRIQTSRYLYTIAPSKIESTTAATAEKLVRRDQNGNASASKFLANGAVTATNAAVIALDGHYKATQTTAPTATPNANAGTGATCAVTAGSNDTAGTIQLTTGSASWAAGAQCAINFNLTYNVAPRCQLTPNTANAATGTANLYKSQSTTAMTVSFVNADIAATAYEWDYLCVEAQ